jgi:WD40 repeat protein
MINPLLKRSVAIPALCLLAFLVSGRLGAAPVDFHISHRVNVHGDEFKSLARTSDGSRLVIGTEKGEVIVWSIADRRILKRLQQGSPVHCVAALPEGRFIIAAGGPHIGQSSRGVVRKWDIDAGTFEELKQSSLKTVTALSASETSGIVVAADPSGGLVAWDSRGQVLATRDLNQETMSIALAGRTIFVTGLDATDTQPNSAGGNASPSNSISALSIDKIAETPRIIAGRQAGMLWGTVDPSPDGNFLATQFAGAHGISIVLADAVTGRELARFPDLSSSAWSKDGTLILFELEVPKESVKIDAAGKLTRASLLDGAKWHGSGTPSDVTGRLISDDSSLVWETFRMGAALGQCTFATKTCEFLNQTPPSAYAMDVQESDGGLIATAGDDRFVRVWKQSDFSLAREFPTGEKGPQGVAIVPGGKTVIYSTSNQSPPTAIMAGDIASGNATQLLSIPEAFVRVFHAADGFLYATSLRVILADPETGASKREFPIESKIALASTSPNGEWLAVGDENGSLYCFQLKTGKLIGKSKEKINSLSAIAVDNDGQSVITAEFTGALRRWQPSADSSEVLTNAGNIKTLYLSSDGKRLVLGGNHKDVAVYDLEARQAVFATRTDDADFEITNVWTAANRLIFTTDAGILFDGELR